MDEAVVQPGEAAAPGGRIGEPGYLGIARASAKDRRRAMLFSGVLIAAFLLTAGYAQVPLPVMPAFVPAYDAAVVVLDLITAVMLHTQYRGLRERGFLWLACGYLFSGLLALVHGISFPDAFVSGSLIGSGQTTAWLWLSWHGGAPLFVAAYALSRRNEPGGKRETAHADPKTHRIAYPVTVLLAGVLALASIYEPDWLPPLMSGSRYRSWVTHWILTAAWSAHVVALALMLWRTRVRRLIDLWLCVTLLAGVIDLALSGIMIEGRYQLGFYVGRLYGLLAALVVLALLLRHALWLHGRFVRAAAALHASESRYRDLFDSMGEAFYVVEALVDANDRVVDMRYLQENPMARRYIGRNVVGRCLSEVDPDFERDWLEIVERVVRTGVEAAFERASPMIGRYFQYRVFRLQGRPRQVGILFQDIKPRRDAEKALRDSEERFRQFGEASPNVLWVRDAESLAMEYVSPAYETLYGKSNRQVLGSSLESWLLLVHPDDRQRTWTNVHRVLEGERVEHEFRVIHSITGQVRWVQSIDFPMRDAACRINRIGGIVQDITQLKQAQTRLQESETRLRSAIEVGRLATWDWNLQTGKVTWSDEHFRLEGYAPGEVTPSYEAWIARVHPEDRDAAEAAVREAMETGGEYVRELRFVHADGSVHWAHARGRFYYDPEGKPVRMIGSMIDNTERHEWEEAQRVLVAELQHRTRNLIAVVRSIADRTLRESEGMKDFALVFSSRLNALARAQDLLSRLKEGQRVTFDELLRMELAAHVDADRSGRIVTEGPGGVSLRSTSVQPLALAVHELITNAVKYGALKQPQGRLRVAWRVELEDGRPWLHVDWRETGVAMKEEVERAQGGGAGRELIERALPYQFGARTTYALTGEGVHCTVALPISARDDGDSRLS